MAARSSSPISGRPSRLRRRLHHSPSGAKNASDRASKSTLQYLCCTTQGRSVVLCILTVQRGPELAGRKRFDRAQPPCEFAGRQTPVAVEQAQKPLCRGFSFL